MPNQITRKFCRSRRRWLAGVALGLPMLAISGCETGGAGLEQFGFSSTLDDDAELSIKVREALSKAAETSNSRILVTTRDDDFVRLSGFVRTQRVFDVAERVAREVDGVNGVINTLTVQE